MYTCDFVYLRKSQFYMDIYSWSILKGYFIVKSISKIFL